MLFPLSFPVLPGSSPHTRDKFKQTREEVEKLRIIPAYAGQITPVYRGEILFQDHPRIRGTNTIQQSLVFSDLGSSPHTRDKSHIPCLPSAQAGIIPAYAGQIHISTRLHQREQDHPRIRGTNMAHRRNLKSRGGSSPHTRDKWPKCPP